MSDLVFDLPTPSAAILGRAQRFPVRRIYCVGRNYAAHAREMGGDPNREPPFFFMKPADAVTPPGDLPYPPDTDNLHHEVELVVAIGHGGTNIEPANAWAHIFGYGIGIDLTRRDRQNEAKAAQQPWDKSKGFDHSAALGLITPSADLAHFTKGAISLSVNGEQRQRGDISDMIWPIPDIIAILSRSWTLQRGDLIYTGTPEGVSAMKRGDEISANIDGLEELKMRVV